MSLPPTALLGRKFNKKIINILEKYKEKRINAILTNRHLR